MRALALLLTASAAFAAVDGTVINRTNGKPQPKAVVTLLKLGEGGMKPAGSTFSDAQGKFRFDTDLNGPALLQAAHGGVAYSLQLAPGATAGIEVSVYDTSKDPATATLSQHLMVLEPAGETVNVTESFSFSNTGNVAYHDPDQGTLRFFTPKDSQPPMVMATGPGGMPVQREAQTKESGVYSVDFPVRPGGETRFDVRYSAPMAAGGLFASKVLYKDVVTRIAVPNGVTVTGDGLKQLGQEPSTGAVIYEVGAAAFKLTLAGSGAMQAAQAAEEDDAGPRIQQIPPPRFQDHRDLILAVTMIALACGFLLLYRKGARYRA